MRLCAGLILMVALLWSGVSQAQVHCSDLPELTLEANFPRCFEQQLGRVGFPDHKHKHNWSIWQTPVDEAGETYGPGALCVQKAVVPRDGLVLIPGEKHYRQFILKHNPQYPDCDMLALVELFDWANHEVPELLGLSISDTLTILNPDNNTHYKEQTGYGVWRLYKLRGNVVTIEPYPILLARSLEAHAVFMLVTDWLLQQALPEALPPWLQQGLVEYIAENGQHLVSYMGEFKTHGPVLYTTAEVDGILAGGVNADEELDRETFRRACYSAYLMVWQLVEYEGGLYALQDFLAQAASGTDLDEASLAVYGMDLAQLGSLLDATINGDPAVYSVVRPAPHREP